jgi:hypothetical protein
MLRGNLRFKPHGSVETADRERMRGDFNGALSSLASLAKINPLAAGMLQDPGVVKSIVEQVLRLYNMPDKQPFMEGLQRAFEQMQQQAQMQQQMAQQGIPPGMPPGAARTAAGGAAAGTAGGPQELMAAIAAHSPQLAQLLQMQPQGGVQ